jgi:type IV pilus assembly protein PilV
MIPNKTPFKAQQGVMLIEALIGILIFSIGILAMMGMQAVAMQTTIDAKYRSEASYLANQIIGTMWADYKNLATYDTSGSGNARLTAWETDVANRLPQDTATPANTNPSIAVAGQQVTVTVRWKRKGDTSVSKHLVIAQINGS